MNMDEGPFFEWFWSDAPTDEERELVNQVGEYEDYFQDMLFEPGTSTYELIQCKSKQEGSDEWIDDEVGRPDELAYFSTTFLKYKVEELGDDMLAYYDKNEQLICVSPEGLKNKHTVPHEMIHVYEDLINELPMYYHDMVYWALYKDLKKKIDNLDDIISSHAHLLTGSTIYSQGGLHDILFLLKSFDLDIRMRYPLGTVFGYGKTEEFKDCTYKKEP